MPDITDPQPNPQVALIASADKEKAKSVSIPPPGPASFKARLAVAPRTGQFRMVCMPSIHGRRVMVWVYDDDTPSSASPTGLFWHGVSAHALLLHERAPSGDFAPHHEPLVIVVQESQAEAEYEEIAARLRRCRIPDDRPPVWLFDEYDDGGKRTRGLRVSFVLILRESEAAPTSREHEGKQAA